MTARPGPQRTVVPPETAGASAGADAARTRRSAWAALVLLVGGLSLGVVLALVGGPWQVLAVLHLGALAIWFLVWRRSWRDLLRSAGPRSPWLLFAVGAVAFHHRASQAAHWVRDNKLRAVGTVIAGYIALQIAGWLAAYASQLLDPAGALGKVSLNDEAVARAVTGRNGGAETLLLFATVAFIGPIVEEFFFRQFLIDFLDQYIPGWASLTISSALFGVYHMHALTLSELINVLPHMSLGIVFSTVYVLTKRNIIMSSAVHIANNLPALALFL